MSIEFQPFPEIEPSSTPDFVVPFDSEHPAPTQSEQLQAGRAFGDCFDELMLANAKEFVKLDGLVPGSKEARLALQADDEAHNGVWEVDLFSRSIDNRDVLDLDNNAFPSKQIDIKYIDASGVTRNSYKYWLDTEGIVRRHDFGDDLKNTVTNYEFAQVDKGQDEVPEIAEMYGGDENKMRSIIAVAQHAVHEAGVEYERDNNLEATLGLNDQPVGVNEVLGLRKFTAPDDPVATK